MSRQLDPHYAELLTKIPGFLEKQINPVVERLILLDFRDAARASEERHPEVLRKAREALGLPIK